LRVSTRTVSTRTRRHGRREFRRRLRGSLALSCVLLAASAIASAQALGAPAAQSPPRKLGVSTNWAGYVALPAARRGSRFSSVSGSWTQPTATCTPGHAAYSAVWVGLGGYNPGSRGLEQIGTDADCGASGHAVYDAWLELLPAAPVNLKLRVRPGDRLVASVTVKGHGVTLRINDLTTGRRSWKTLRSTHIDTSSAEWIVEAPSECTGASTCEPLPLTDFGEVLFSGATATAGAHTGPITDPRWSASALELQQRLAGAVRGIAGDRAAPTRTLTVAAPTASSAPYGAFSVSWQQQPVELERENPTTLPSSADGAP